MHRTLPTGALPTCLEHLPTAARNLAMIAKQTRRSVVLVLGLATIAFGRGLDAGPGPVEDAAFFGKEVLPILKANCFKCHGEGKVKGGLRLSSRQALLTGGDSGPAVVLDRP